MNKYKTLRLILGDQLNASHSWFKQDKTDVVYLITELKQETGYVKHHKQKIQAFFAAMEAFAQGLQTAGFNVDYLTLDDSCQYSDLNELIVAKLAQYQVTHFEHQQPDEYRLSQQLSTLAATLAEQNISSQCVDSEHFYLPSYQLPDYFSANKKHRLEHFYRQMRQRFNLLMVDDKPEGEQWNFDQDNRNKLSKQEIQKLPSAKCFNNDVSDINQRLAKHKIDSFGEASDQLLWPINRRQALELLDYFCQICLPCFGRFQDAMTCQSDDIFEDKQWSLYHSRLSFALNSKILSPMQVVDHAIAHYRQRPEQISLAQVEGFVRQIVGWREFVRGIYWANMPNYQHMNALSAQADLPEWFWHGQTKMNCLKHSIGQSLKYSYAHHIQRLMVIGNFALLAGVDPDQVDAWYLGVYIDAIEWVEMPNTRGMSQFADGGILASKPYAASGNYIAKMSDYCVNCHYKVKEKVGAKACPFNSLYWRFMNKHRERIGKNPRTAMVYRNWDKQPEAQKLEVLAHADSLIDTINKL